MKNTPVRTLTNTSGKYNMMTIEILHSRYGGKNHLEPLGTVTFQQNIGENKWYGMNFEIWTDNANKMKKFTKMVEFIGKNTHYDTQPDELKKLIGADEHVYFESDFVSLSKNGQRLYKVLAEGGHYSSIIAPDDKAANKELKKLNIANSRVEFYKEVKL